MLPMKVSVAEGCMTSSYFHTMMQELTPMAGRQQGTPKGWLFLPVVVGSLEPEKAISGMRLSCTSSTGSMVDPRAASRPLVFGDHRARAMRLVDASAALYSGMTSPEPPNSFGKSPSLGTPSRIGKTVSA
jgi:hypothetical protein